MVESDFVLEPINSYFWNLKLLETKIKRTGFVVEEFGDNIYGISLVTALNKIATLRASKNFNGTLIEFLRKWRKERKVLENLEEKLRLEISSKI